MSMKKKALAAASYVMVAALAIGGTVAYLTDRDNATNVFTMGNVDIELNEDFVQGSELIPTDVKNATKKEVTITNTGKSDAWVWYTYAIPKALDNAEGVSSKNVLHVNHPGRFWLGYEENKAYWVDGQTEAVAKDQCWIIDNKVIGTKDVDGVTYNVYAVLYNGTLEANETTNVGMSTVYLDAHVDIDPEGNLHHVEKGVVEEIDWNINEDGAPKIFVNAYAIQADGFADVKAAYDAYVGQWGELNGVYEELTLASSEAELVAGGNVALSGDVALEGAATTIDQPTTIDLNDANLSASRTASSAAESSVLNVTADTTLTGSGTVQNDIDYCLTLNNNAALTIEDGTYTGVTTAVNVVTGTLYIKGGTFEETGTKDNGHFLINCIDANYKNGTANVVITGGTFKNWNPANNTSEGTETNFVADGYEVVETVDGADTWYTVVAK